MLFARQFFWAEAADHTPKTINGICGTKFPEPIPVHSRLESDSLLIGRQFVTGQIEKTNQVHTHRGDFRSVFGRTCKFWHMAFYCLINSISIIKLLWITTCCFVKLRCGFKASESFGIIMTQPMCQTPNDKTPNEDLRSQIQSNTSRFCFYTPLLSSKARHESRTGRAWERTERRFRCRPKVRMGSKLVLLLFDTRDVGASPVFTLELARRRSGDGDTSSICGYHSARREEDF